MVPVRQAACSRRPPRPEQDSCDWALHVQCAWQLTRHQEIVIAQQDLYEPAEIGRADEVGITGRSWSSERGGPTRLDERTAVFRRALNVNSPVVESVQADWAGGLRITLSGDYLLEIRPIAAARTRLGGCSSRTEPPPTWS